MSTATLQRITKPLVSDDIKLPYTEHRSNNFSAKCSEYLPTCERAWYDRLPLFHVEEPAIPLKDIPAVPTWAPPKPPATKAILSELDISQIVYNPKLRHDINFDHDLHFRPNLDGERGRRKAQKANKFWIELEAQLKEFIANPTVFENGLAGSEWSLPITIREIGVMLETLIPPEDRSAGQDVLNVNLLMKNLKN